MKATEDELIKRITIDPAICHGMTKFLMDAQLPRRLAHTMRELGCDVVHTLDMPNGNRTSDTEINLISLEEQRS